MNKLNAKISWTNIAIALAIAIFFTADRWLKLTALNAAGAAWPLLGDIFSFHFTANRYIAFSLPLGGMMLNIFVTAVIVALATYAAYLGWKKNYAPKSGALLDIISLLLIIAGALSNLFDRLAYGYVIDYLDLRYFTVFNLSDALITVGAAILIWRGLKRQ